MAFAGTKVNANAAPTTNAMRCDSIAASLAPTLIGGRAAASPLRPERSCRKPRTAPARRQAGSTGWEPSGFGGPAAGPPIAMAIAYLLPPFSRTSVEQHPGEIERPILRRHVQGGVVAVPHRAFGIDVDTVLDQPSHGFHVPL